MTDDLTPVPHADTIRKGEIRDARGGMPGRDRHPPPDGAPGAPVTWRMKAGLSLEASAEGVGLREYPVAWWPDSWRARLLELEGKGRFAAVSQCYTEALRLHSLQVRERLREIPVNTCNSCGAAIVWVVTRNGKRMPLDAEPVVTAPDSLAGTVPRVIVTPEGQVVRGWIPHDGYKGPTVKGLVSHFATCPNADAHRRP